MHWYLKVLKNYFVFRGRARRKEYWMFLLVHILIMAVLFGVDLAVRRSVEEVLVATVTAGSVYGWAVLVPSITVQVRRLHDSNRSGWWLLVVLVPQLVGWVIGLSTTWDSTGPSSFPATMGPVLMVIGVVTGLASLVLIVFLCLDGTGGENRFGPDPKGRSEEESDIWPDVA